MLLGCFVLDLSANTCQTHHVILRPRDLATLTFDLQGHGTCRWCRSSSSVCVSSLKFYSLPVRKIWRTSGLSISRPGDLDLWRFTSKLMPIIARGMDNLPTNFGVSRTLRSGTYRPTPVRCITWPCDLDLGGHGACWWCRSSFSICMPSLKFVGLPVR